MLDEAIAVTGFDGRVVIGSWYGDRPAHLRLGGSFHRSRMRLISSQVSTIAPRFAGRWSQARRREVAWRMLAEIEPARLIIVFPCPARTRPTTCSIGARKRPCR